MKKINKKLLSVFLACVMLCAMVAMPASASTPYGLRVETYDGVDLIGVMYATPGLRWIYNISRVEAYPAVDFYVTLLAKVAVYYRGDARPSLIDISNNEYNGGNSAYARAEITNVNEDNLVDKGGFCRFYIEDYAEPIYYHFGNTEHIWQY